MADSVKKMENCCFIVRSSIPCEMSTVENNDGNTVAVQTNLSPVSYRIKHFRKGDLCSDQSRKIILIH